MMLDKQVALITGAGSGIGKAAAMLLAREGASIAALGRSADELEATVAELRNQGHQAIAITADVGNAEQVKAAVERAAGQWGRLDIVFANAGVNGVWAPLEELTLEEWSNTLNVNLTGTFLTVKHALPWLKKRGGSIIVTSSVNGNRIFSNTGATAYSCSKAAQVAFVKMVALEVAKHKVRVNVVCPGWIETEISENTEQRNVEREKEPVEYPEGKVPLTDGRPGSAEQVARLVLFLASDAASHITGTEIYIDGGESLLQG